MEQERIPFDIKHRPEIEAGKYLVKTREGNSVRIVCWEAKLGEPLVCLVTDEKGREDLWIYPISGRYDGKTIIGGADLFLVPNPDSTTTCSTSVDWDAFRREAAKDIVAACYAERMGRCPEEHIAEMALKQADELIKQLKEGKK